MDIVILTIGFIVGVLVGLTGMGGAAILTPLLILVRGVPPVMAVGSDLVFSAITKPIGAWQHYREGTVDIKLASCLAMGSIPASLMGGFLVEGMKKWYGFAVDQLLTKGIGIVLIVVSVLIVLRSLANLTGLSPSFLSLSLRERKISTVILGTIVGFLVGVTSVGSGTIVVLFLSLFYKLPASRIVGTDLFHATLLTSFIGLFHLIMGNADLHLVLNLLLGSIPGVYLGGRICFMVPSRVLKGILALLLFLIGINLV